MARKPKSSNAKTGGIKQGGNFHIEFKNSVQKAAWQAFQQHDVLFLIGPAGTGKSHLSCAFAIEQVLNNHKKKIVLTRPIVESGEKLGFLPGEFEEKVHPYMMPMYDCMDKMLGREGVYREKIDRCVEVAPIAYMRGRAEVLDSPIMTPTGIKLMGEMKMGDYVIGSDGKPIEVIGVFPQGKKQIYKVNFSDGTFVRCSGDHLWSTMTLNEKRHNKGYSVKTTEEISKNVKNKHNQKIHRVPILSGPVEFERQEVDVDPYLLGILLGDGHIGKSAIRISSVDEEILRECEERIPNDLKLKHRNKCDYSIASKSGKNSLLFELEKLGLIGKKSHDKFIPDSYKINTKEIRLNMLRGIMDADGWVCEHRSGSCRVQYCSTSENLAKDVMFLVRSLGGYAYYRKRDYDESGNHEYDGHTIRHVHSSYVVDIMMDENPFLLSRKSTRFSPNPKPAKLIDSIDVCGEEECQCIKVKSEDSLYVTNGFNLTHNTFSDAVCIFDEGQNATMTQLKLFLTRFDDNSKIIITGDPAQSDLSGAVALLEVIKKTKDIEGIGIVEFKSNSIVRHPLIEKIIKSLED